MSYQPAASLSPALKHRSAWSGIIQRLFRDYRVAFAVRLWDGETIFIGRSMPHFTLVFKSPEVFRDSILRRDPRRLAHAYFSGGLDVEGDLYRALNLGNFPGLRSIRFIDRIRVLVKALALGFSPAAEAHWVGRREGAGRAHAAHREMRCPAITFQGDLPGEFYRAWLGEKMVCSCAHFEDEKTSLADAQDHELEQICRKLQLKPGERMLDIDCGWGALAMHAARHHGVQATGVTSGQAQYDWARRRVREDGLEGKVTIELLDYRNITGDTCFDKISSVGIFQPAGPEILSTRFDTIHRLLTPGGLFLGRGIVNDGQADRKKSPASAFIGRDVFADGERHSIGDVRQALELAQFELREVEGLRQHCASTLRKWVSQLDAARNEALRHVDEATLRMWRLYMAGSALHFENGDIGAYQILASKREPGTLPVPLTREDRYSRAPQARSAQKRRAVTAL